MALLDDIIAALPTYGSVVGEDWLRGNKEWVERFLADRIPWYAQVEGDLGILRQHVHLDRLGTCYRSVLREHRSQQEAFCEIHGTAFLAKLARTVELHVPRDQSSWRNFDVRVHIGEHVLDAFTESPPGVGSGASPRRGVLQDRSPSPERNGP